MGNLGHFLLFVRPQWSWCPFQCGEPTWALLFFFFCICNALVLFKIWVYQRFTQLIVHKETYVGGVEDSRV